MAADSARARSDAPPCPDPSAHDHGDKLSTQASTAALLATGSKQASATRSTQPQEDVLGLDGKLSSKSKRGGAEGVEGLGMCVWCWC